MKYAIAIAVITTATLAAQAVPSPPQGRGRGGSPPPMPEPLAMADHIGFESIFDGSSMKGWDGDPAFWRAADGALTGRSSIENPVKQNTFLIWRGGTPKDFELKLEYRLSATNSGVQIRSVPVEGGEARGCQADAGAGWWGKLYEEGARGLLFPKKGQAFDGDKFIKKEDWNVYEILVVGNKIRTAINGNLCTDLEDEKIAPKGRIGLQVHAGGPMEVRFRNFQLELNPKFELKTVKQ